MKNSRLFLTTPLFALGLSLAQLSASVVIFEPDFSGTYTGGGANQFTNYYQASGDYSTVSVVGGRFQFQSNHQDLGNDPALQGDNQSAVQLSRNKSSDPLPFVNSVGMISLDWRWSENEWGSADNTVFNMQIGGNFRTGAFNPSGGGGNGPAFASLSLQGRATVGQFRVISGGGPGSSNFNLSKDGDGFYNASIVALFNNSGADQNLPSPDGNYVLNTGSLALWINGTLVWNTVANINTAAVFENISFGFGNGTNHTLAGAEPFGGTSEISNIVVSTIPEPSTYAAIFGLAVLGLALYRRRQS